jgi:hypothetical protein
MTSTTVLARSPGDPVPDLLDAYQAGVRGQIAVVRLRRCAYTEPLPQRHAGTTSVGPAGR